MIVPLIDPPADVGNPRVAQERAGLACRMLNKPEEARQTKCQAALLGGV